MAKKQLALISSLTNARNRTLVIVMAVLLIIGVGFAISKFRSSGDDPLASQGSVTGGVPNIRSIPGAKAPEKYVKLQREENIQKADDAIKKKTASIPTIIGAIQDSTPDEVNIDLGESSAGLQEADNDPKIGKIQLGEAQAGTFIDTGPFKGQSERERRRQELEQRRQEQIARVDKMRAEQQAQKDAELQRRQADKDQKAYEKEVQAIQKQMGNYAKGAYTEWSSYKPQTYTAGKWSSQEYKTRTQRLLEEARDGDNIITTVTDAAGNPQGITITKRPESAKAKQDIIKAGSILFAVLDTAVNTDEPGPVLATIVHGKYKGSKLIGAIEHADRQEKVIMTFETMSIPANETSNTIKAVAIDVNTARTAVGSDVNKHYLLRYGSLFASSFLEGYSKAISEQGTTTTVSPLTGATTQTKPELSGSEEFFVALGEVGKRWGQQIRPIFNMPYTVTVNQGTGLGILFLSDASVSPRATGIGGSGGSVLSSSVGSKQGSDVVLTSSVGSKQNTGQSGGNS